MELRIAKAELRIMHYCFEAISIIIKKISSIRKS